MKKIHDYMTYEGGEIRPFTLYISGSDPIILEGKVDFTIFGTCRMNGIKLNNASMHVSLAKATEFIVEKDSAILFNAAPIVAREVPENIPVPDVPDEMEHMERQMYMMFEQFLARKGYSLPAEGEGDSPSPMVDADDLDDEDQEYDFDIPLDPPSIAEPDNVKKLDIDQFREPQETAETLQTDLESVSEEEETAVSDDISSDAAHG